MSIESEINRIKQNIANAYTYCSEKGGTMPQTQDSANLAATVSSVPSGVDIYDYIEEEPLNDYDVFAGRFLFKKIPEITINEHITSLQGAFDYYKYLEEIGGITNNANGTVYGFNASAMFRDCIALISIPLFDTKKITNVQNMFRNCTSLTTVPVFDLRKATNVENMFYNCTSLTNDSLNNIMAMCVGATSYSGTKTLKQLGLSSTQATTCTGLSNYSSFTAAGWTTGY